VAVRAARAEGGAHVRRRREQREIDRTAVGLRRVVGDHGQRRPRLHRRPFIEQVEPESATPHDDHQIVAGERLAAPATTPVHVSCEQRMVLREAGLTAEGLLPHRATQPLSERDHRGPTLDTVDAGTDDQDGSARIAHQGRQLADRALVDA
jgi:hypothetical protein